MKSLRLCRNGKPLDRSMAWTCLMSNLALPGSGSLLAGRASGYLPAALALAGMALTLVFGLRFMLWFLEHREQFFNPDGDPFENLRALWLAVRWAVLGMGLFAGSWVWGLITGLMLVWSTSAGNAPGGKIASAAASSVPPPMRGS